MVGAGAVTTIENAGNDVVTWPSLALMTMPPNVPAVAVPVRAPVDELSVAQFGRFVAENVSVSPLASLAVGVNE